MCRLAMFNKEGLRLIEEKYGLEKFLDRLEKECGGHGNGVCFTNGKGYLLKKGMDLTNKEIIHMINNVDFEWVLYHTRVASIGAKKDSNCHPYREGNIVLAMNGTERDFKVQADVLDITDTEAVLKTITALKMPVLTTLSKLGSVFMGFSRGVPYVTLGQYKVNLRITKDDKGAIVFASSLPKEFDVYEPKEFPFVWCPDKSLTLDTLIKKEVFTTTYYNSGNRGVGRHWWESDKETKKEKRYNEKIWREAIKDSDLDLD